MVACLDLQLRVTAGGAAELQTVGYPDRSAFEACNVGLTRIVEDSQAVFACNVVSLCEAISTHVVGGKIELPVSLMLL